MDDQRFLLAAALHKWLNGKIDVPRASALEYRKGFNDAILDVKLKLEELHPTLAPKKISSSG